MINDQPSSAAAGFDPHPPPLLQSLSPRQLRLLAAAPTEAAPGHEIGSGNTEAPAWQQLQGITANDLVKRLGGSVTLSPALPEAAKAEIKQQEEKRKSLWPW